MVAPQLDTEHPGIRVIAEVASVLQAGSASGVALRGVVGALRRGLNLRRCRLWLRTPDGTRYAPVTTPRSEEHTSELQSQSNLVCRLLLEKQKERCDCAPVTTAARL